MIRWLGLVLVICCMSCKRDKLEGDYSLLEGDWVWAYSTYYDPGGTLDTIWNGSVEHCLAFETKGIVTRYWNGSKQECFRVVVDGYDSRTYGDLINILLNNDQSNKWNITIYASSYDTMNLAQFPYNRFEHSISESYQNYFVRQ